MMNFNTQITDFFSDFSLRLGNIPPKHHIYLYADYVELISLFSNQNFVSSTDIMDRFKDEGIIKQQKEDSEQSIANDKEENFVDSIYRLLGERILLFGEDYPFDIESVDKIKLRDKETLSVRNKIYIYLLLSSSLNVFKDFQRILTTEFEILSKEVLLNFLPKNAIVKSFGKNSEYRGTVIQKIQKLAEDMKIPIRTSGINAISQQGTQERGLDLVGWIPFDDKVANFLSIFAQCACGKEWYKKINETTRYHHYIEFHRLKPTHTMFIPYSLIDSNKYIFYRNDEFDDRLIFERKRILNYITETDFFENLESKQLVEECIIFEEDIV